MPNLSLPVIKQAFLINLLSTVNMVQEASNYVAGKKAIVKQKPPQGAGALLYNKNITN